MLDGLNLNLVILDNSNRKYDYPIIEPCFFEFHFSSVIMTPEMWKKEYFPFTEITLDLPTVKISLHKQMLFILNDYLDNYIYPLVNVASYINDLNHKILTKSDIKQAKLRSMIFKRLLEDFSHQSNYKQTEALKIYVNELKFKYSRTKILQIFQLNCYMLNVYIFKDEDQSHLVPLIETQPNRAGLKTGKDFIEVKAQLPLMEDLTSTYIPGK